MLEDSLKAKIKGLNIDYKNILKGIIFILDFLILNPLLTQVQINYSLIFNTSQNGEALKNITL